MAIHPPKMAMMKMSDSFPHGMDAPANRDRLVAQVGIGNRDCLFAE